MSIDPATGYMHFFGYWFLQPYLTYNVVDTQGRIIHSTTIDVGASMRLNLRYQWVLIYTMGADAWAAAGEDITAALRDRALPIGEAAGLPIHRFPLEQTAAAHDAVEGTVVGKVLIDVSGR